MNPLRWSFRQACLAGLLCCLALLGYALYAQHQMFLDPCPLCILQRVAFMVMAAGFLAGLVFGKGRVGRWLGSAVVVIGSGAGVAIAGRHVWLQGLPPDQVPACGPGLEYMLEAFPLRDVLSKVFHGSGECAKIDWSFLGISMPGWTLIWYLLLAALVLFALFRARDAD
ncbi:disulfide bond formation protein B [Pseudomarimonas salicorniae]|uniref:Disulfide bond formation protein B n=1 Tax=Pseudomarimonas salicorniae TaxID=2933270 RepID=A0ABT0GI73_9GAMM|nr:disulfide bond formation protein B [Lysobacter sp. CAU 1642]MCK7594244.1 disulfide bond formation protein B [Lysobacter sp. CAU 1642]